MKYYEPGKERGLPKLALPKDVSRLPGTYWNPSARFIEELSTFLEGRKVLEVFAGNGYLAGQLKRNGIDVLATSLHSGHDLHEHGLYHPVEAIDARLAVLTHGQNRDVLLICWPTTVPAVVEAAELWGQEKTIVFIGEVTDYTKHHLGGCATDEFFEHIEVFRVFDAYTPGNMLESAFACRYRDEGRPLPGKRAAG